MRRNRIRRRTCRRSPRGLWSAGFLSAQHAGVALPVRRRPGPVHQQPRGVPADVRRRMLDGLDAAERAAARKAGRSRDAHAHRAVRDGVPHAGDRAGADGSVEGAGEHLQALRRGRAKSRHVRQHLPDGRRLVERGVRFVQVYHHDWDAHGNLPEVLPSQCKDVDQACYALVQDLKQRGMLDDTLVIWGGEFGRTIYSQGKLTATDYGRDHHPRCFTMWMAGGGFKHGVVHGETDEFSYNIVKDPVHVRDFHATVLHLLGIDHERFTYRYQGLDQKLTGVEKARVVSEILS